MEKFRPLTPEVLANYEKVDPAYQSVKHNIKKQVRYIKNGENSFENVDKHKNDDVQIICVGDMLCEEKLYLAHHINVNSESEYCFDDIFQFVRSEFKKADLVIGNLETTICESAPYTGEHYKINGKYHCNAPVAFLDAIQRAGFDFLMLANNHNCDCGVNGVLETLHHIDERSLMRTGLFSLNENNRYTIVKVKDITLGCLSYSTWYNRNETNFTDLGREKLLNEYRVDRVKRDIDEAKRAGAEFILVYMHWGIDAEYKSVQSESMKNMAQEVANCGADYIIGSHTHSVQPYAVLETDDGRKVPCVYSLGNFVTSELNKISRENLIWKLYLERKDGKIKITKEDYIPCYIPDKAYNCAYPIVPRSLNIENMDLIEKCKEVYKHLDTVVNREIGLINHKTFLSKHHICFLLGLDCTMEKDETYTSINFAMDTRDGGIAVISDITSNPVYKTPQQRCEELADIAMQKGAKLLISTVQIKDYPCLLVNDVFQVYCTIVTEMRKLFSPKTISITGSIGKSTTTEITYAVLSSKYNTHRNTGSANSVRYAGTVLQQLKTEHEAYVQETMEGPPYGTASTISKMVQPQAAIITVVGTSHFEAFGSQERILESCLGVQDGMPDNGLLILNGDDPFQKNAQCKKKVVYYAIDNQEADYRAVNIRGEGQSLLFDILHEGTSTPVRLYCFGKHNVLNALAAFAAGKWAGMTDQEIVNGLAKFKTSGIRQNLVRYGGHTLFLDCYNAAPESMQSAFDAFSMIQLPAKGRRIAVLADIKEVGDRAIEIHRQVGKMVLQSKIDLLICYGEMANHIAAVVKEAGKIPVLYSDCANEIIEFVKTHATKNDVVLFKGSHGMALEEIVDKVYGTWFHEEFEQYDFKTKIISDANLKYRVHPDHVTVINKISEIKDVIIPDSVEGLPVTGIEQNVFNSSKYTHLVQLSNNLTNIRYCSFYKADNITNVTIPPSVRIIDTSAFSTCANLETVDIQPGCTHIGYRAFGNCKNLKTIVIPPTVQQIGDEAFLNCNQLAIYGEKNSCAEEYAKKHNIPFKLLNQTKDVECKIEDVKKRKGLFSIFKK